MIKRGLSAKEAVVIAISTLEVKNNFYFQFIHEYMWSGVG